MPIPAIRCALTGSYDIEAAFRDVSLGLRRVIVDPISGEVLYTSVKKGSDEFRWLVKAAREHCRK